MSEGSQTYSYKVGIKCPKDNNKIERKRQKEE